MQQLKAFSHPMLYVNDLARAIRWYKETLGFHIRYEAPGAYASLFHQQMNMRLDLHPTEANSSDVGFGPIIYFKTSHIEEALNELRDKGVKVGTARKEGGGPRFASFWDSEGNTLGLEEQA